MKSLLRVCKYDSGKMKGTCALASIPPVKNEELVKMRMLNVRERKSEKKGCQGQKLEEMGESIA